MHWIRWIRLCKACRGSGALYNALATNACVENKGSRARLLMIGVDRDLSESLSDNLCVLRFSGAGSADQDRWEAREDLLRMQKTRLGGTQEDDSRAVFRL